MNPIQLQNIIKSIRRFYPVSNSSIEQLVIHFEEQHFHKNQYLVEAGMRSNYVYFIEKGCARTFFRTNTVEITNWFSKEGDVTFSSNALYHRTPAQEHIELLEDAVTYRMPVDKLNELYNTNIEIANWSRIIHQEVLLKMQTLRLDRLSLSAKERYAKFIQEYPGLIIRVNLGHIASYLGMTQQHLSIIRAESRF